MFTTILNLETSSCGRLILRDNTCGTWALDQTDLGLQSWFGHLLSTDVCMRTQLLSLVRPFVTPWTSTHQAPLSKGFPKQEYWNGLPFPSPGDLPNPGIKPASPTWQMDSLPLSHQPISSDDLRSWSLTSSTLRWEPSPFFLAKTVCGSQIALWWEKGKTGQDWALPQEQFCQTFPGPGYDTYSFFGHAQALSSESADTQPLNSQGIPCYVYSLWVTP